MEKKVMEEVEMTTEEMKKAKLEAAWKLISADLIETVKLFHSEDVVECLGLGESSKHEEKVKYVLQETKKANSHTESYGIIVENSNSLKECLLFLHVYWGLRLQQIEKHNEIMSLLIKEINLSERG